MAVYTPKVVCKSCEHIGAPRDVYDNRGRQENSECQECGAYLGKFDGMNSNFVIIGKDDEENPVFIHMTDEEIRAGEPRPDIEDYR